MNQNTINTERLLITPLHQNDKIFIRELVNSKGWLAFIGERNVHSDDDASAYIQKIIDNPNTNYWTVKIKDTDTAAGIITLITRDYLENPDIGFAFLPQFNEKGYAFEATNAVLIDIIQNGCTGIDAITVPENTSSIALLKKLGLQFDKTIEIEKETLQVFTLAAKS
jgi:ribosomal-protein-alanine N-acetyltransferase